MIGFVRSEVSVVYMFRLMVADVSHVKLLLVVRGWNCSVHGLGSSHDLRLPLDVMMDIMGDNELLRASCHNCLYAHTHYYC